MEFSKKQLFLVKAYKVWPLYFFICVIFIVGTLVSAFIIGQSVTPFYVYQMYSQPIEGSNNGTFISYYINDKKLNTFNLYQETGDIIRCNTDRFFYLKANNHKDKYFQKLRENGLGKLIPDLFFDRVLSVEETNDKQYAIWFKNYLSKFLTQKINSITLKQLYYSYNEKGELIPLKEKVIIKFNYE